MDRFYKAQQRSVNRVKIIIEISDDELYEFQDQLAEWVDRIENAIEKIEAQAKVESETD